MKGAIVYISSNREKPEFENMIVQDMISKKGLLPVFSVTQKPVNLGTNRHVGNVGTSGFNFCRQLQMAVEMAKVDYVISCEADCLYSPDYYTFVPPKNAVYRNTNNYMMPLGKAYWHSKSSQTAFQVSGRDFLLDRLNLLLKGQPKWDTKMKNFPKEIGKKFLEGWETFKTKYPCFTIKTGDAMRGFSASGREKLDTLPYWGKAEDVRKKYL